jgi:DNA mismatch endonuclease (patch repair protein)
MDRILRKKLPGGSFGFVTKQRSKAMGAVRGSGNRTTERRLRMMLAQAAISGWQVRPPGIIGKPDFVFPNRRLAVFTDGCFWHGCRRCWHASIRSNAAYWTMKLRRNRDRDVATTRKLRRRGWTVLRFWEHEIQSSPRDVLFRLRQAICA